MRLDGDAYRCVLCGAVLDVPDGARPRVTIEGTGGKPNERVIYLRGEEIHHCVIGSATAR